MRFIILAEEEQVRLTELQRLSLSKPLATPELFYCDCDVDQPSSPECAISDCTKKFAL